MLAWAAHTAACADHTFDKVLGKLSDLHQKQGLLALCAAAAAGNLRLDLLTHFLKALQNGIRNAAAIAEALAEYRAS